MVIPKKAKRELSQIADIYIERLLEISDIAIITIQTIVTELNKCQNCPHKTIEE